MTDNTLIAAPATQLHKSPIAVKFFELLDLADNDFNQNGKLSFSIIEKILGKPPIIPSSPDMDARLEAYEELTQYSMRASNIESKIRTYAEKRS